MSRARGGRKFLEPLTQADVTLLINLLRDGRYCESFDESFDRCAIESLEDKLIVFREKCPDSGG